MAGTQEILQQKPNAVSMIPPSSMQMICVVHVVEELQQRSACHFQNRYAKIKTMEWSIHLVMDAIIITMKNKPHSAELLTLRLSKRMKCAVAVEEVLIH